MARAYNYDIQFYVKRVTSTIYGYRLSAVGDIGSTSIYATPRSNISGWRFIRTTVTLENIDERRLTIEPVSSGGTPVANATFYIKGLIVKRFEPAEVQESELISRRRTYYEGTKMTSTDINVDSPDTIDGGPVVEIKVVASTFPTYNPLGTATGPSVTTPIVTTQFRTSGGTTGTVAQPFAQYQEGRGLLNLTDTGQTGNPQYVVDVDYDRPCAYYAIDPNTGQRTALISGYIDRNTGQCIGRRITPVGGAARMAGPTSQTQGGNVFQQGRGIVNETGESPLTGNPQYAVDVDYDRPCAYYIIDPNTGQRTALVRGYRDRSTGDCIGRLITPISAT